MVASTVNKAEISIGSLAYPVAVLGEGPRRAARLFWVKKKKSQKEKKPAKRLVFTSAQAQA